MNNNYSTWADLSQKLGPLKWDWDLWLAPGFQTLIAGVSGAGKSNLMLHICRVYIEGIDWPDGTPFSARPGKILWCESESSQALNEDRAKRWGIPMEFVRTPGKDVFLDISLDDPKQKKLIRELADDPEIVLIVIDSLSGSTRKNTQKSQEALALGQWIAQLARDTKKVVLVGHHIRKKSQTDGDRIDLDRLRDSSAIAQTCRVVLAIDMPNIYQEDLKRLYVVKNNLAKKPEKDIGFTIKDDGLIFDEAPIIPVADGPMDKAKELICKMLTQKEFILSSTVEELAEEEGISWSSMMRAKKFLGIPSEKKGGIWFWRNPHPSEINLEVFMRNL